LYSLFYIFTAYWFVFVVLCQHPTSTTTIPPTDIAHKLAVVFW